MVKIVLFVLLLILLILISPITVIWALNTLFHLNIDLTFFTWLAMIIILMSINGYKGSGKA